MQTTILGIFLDRNKAENALAELNKSGYNSQDISIIMRDQVEREKLVNNTGTKVAEGTLSGAATGGALGGIAGLLVGIGAITIPGIGAVLIGGPLAVALG